ncbi:glycosyltransferase family 4 protein [Bacillus sp. EB600]|uniref:glycosyltransferase family 4 protein n=1 Tax=Bacillus sp. EB600 TaxID=2806345 RepID=UPI00210E1FB8|nr:glycosyltransferase family 4 protein [Bacillus sp. EB600]MCQ6280004.1 glycosyltransferase family 4 protein [Bacillus sp. EB600]
MNVLITESGTRFAKGYRFELYKSIREMGHTVCFLDQSINEEYTDEDGDMHIPLKNFTLRSNKNPVREIEFINSLKKIFKKSEIDYILIYGIKIIPSMSLAAKLAGVKRCVCVINGAGTLFMSNDFKIKLLRFIAFPMLKVAFSCSDAVLFQNQDDYEIMIKLNLVTKMKARRTNGSGVNLENYSVASLNPDNNFLLITRLTEAKGIHEFIAAASMVKEKYPSSSFHLVGPKDDLDGSIDWDKVNSAISQKIITYHGATNDVTSFIRQSRVFVFPSFYREGVPRAVLEAMSMGRPIVTTNSPGCRETVKDGVNGFLVEPRNSKNLAEKICWMIENPEAVDKMGVESRKLAEKKFDINKVNQKVLFAVFGQ